MSFHYRCQNWDFNPIPPKPEMEFHKLPCTAPCCLPPHRILEWELTKNVCVTLSLYYSDILMLCIFVHMTANVAWILIWALHKWWDNGIWIIVVHVLSMYHFWPPKLISESAIKKYFFLLISLSLLAISECCECLCVYVYHKQ